jgi:predicted metal-dependent hydrolase
MRIVVKPDLCVTVDVPNGFNDDEIMDALRSKARWIVRQLGEFEDYHPLPTPYKFISGETFVYLGRQYRLKVEQGGKAPAKLRGCFLHVTVPERSDNTAVRSAVDSWYRERADDVFRRYLASCMIVAGRHGVKLPVLTIREMRTRWGSCSAAGRVTLNLRLIHAPVHCIEYVVMHELCHLVHHDHSPQFFRLLTRCMPDWKKRRAILSRVVIPNQPPQKS